MNTLLDRIEYAKSVSALPDVRRYILITDISVTHDTAQRLDAMSKTFGFDIDLIDHHQVKEEMYQFEWVHVNNDSDVCGTSLLRDHLSGKPTWCCEDSWDALDSVATLHFVNDVCEYDTWRFDKTKETNSENLNTLLTLMCRDDFEMMMTSYLLANPDIPYEVSDEPEYAFVESANRKRKEYCALRNRSMRIVEYKGYKVGVVFGERYMSSLGDYILEHHPSLDFCAVVNLPSSVSLRTKSDTLNLGLDIARPLGGGGHPKAAGYQIDDIPDDLIRKLIFEKEVT